MLRASSRDEGRPHAMLYAGLDLSRKRLDFCLLDQLGEKVEVGAAPPDADGLRSLSTRVGRFGEPVFAAIESMNGARFVHDQLELAGWRVVTATATNTPNNGSANNAASKSPKSTPLAASPKRSGTCSPATSLRAV